MTTFGIAMVKDEADVIEATVTQMLSQVDGVLVADNGSSDGTKELLAGLPITLIEDPEVGYFQSDKMTRLAARAQELGADWVVPFDADEWWYSPFGRIADVLSDHPGAVATAPIFDHVATGVDPDEVDPTGRIGWRRREPCPLHKVACRPALPLTITQGNHGAHYPTQHPLNGHLVIRHFPHRSVEQLVRKVRNGAAAYAATDLPEDQGRHWREWGKLLDERGEDAIAELFREWYWSADPATDPDLIFDPAPCPSVS
jgi:glycosyltransferase involved in cell wall biosynthesis